MIKLVGNVVVLLLLYFALALDESTAAAVRGRGFQFLGERIGLNGILSLAAGLLIITGGIDLSMGSTVALASVVLWKVLIDGVFGYVFDPYAGAALVLGFGALIGLAHGLLVTLTNMQPFVVTLCGLFVYRSLARWLAGEDAQGFGDEFLDLQHFWGTGRVGGVPVHFIFFLALLAAFGVFLHLTRYGRYFFAIGSNEKAARYCGLPTTQYRTLAYVLCSTLTALYAVLNMFKTAQVTATTTGNLAELYGIAAAVLGGCSLRGGEGNVVGIFLGTCVLWVLPTFITFKGFNPALEGVIFGLVLLAAALFDELLRRYSGTRRV